MAAALVALSSLAGCATLGGVSSTVVADQRSEHVVAGTGSPVVVFESGLGGSLDWWAKVLPDVAKHTTAFAYNRPGNGGSAPARSPRDGDHVVEELRALLRARNLSPPYVLVGHSVGGLYMQLFARRHPAEVAGLVLVDSTHPEQLSGAGARQSWPVWVKLAFGIAASDIARRELDAIPATGQALLALPPLTGKPVVVLSAEQPMSETSELARDSNAKRVDIARLNPGARQVWVDSGHAIPLDKPAAVIEAVLDVLRQARARAGIPAVLR